MSYPLDALRREVAYIAYHFHWDRESVLEMEHAERAEWVREIAGINQRMNGQEDE
ncbi:MAG: DUF6760 family protein [Verrucomicrobiota bacterium]